MNRLLSIGLSIAVAPAILIGVGNVIGSEDMVLVSSKFLFGAALPLGALLVLAGLLARPVRHLREKYEVDAALRRAADATTATVERIPWLSETARRSAGALRESAVAVRAWAGRRTPVVMTLPGTWLLISLGLSGLALFLPFESDSKGTAIGLHKLLTGWFFVLSAQTPVWLAAPLLFFAWICLAVKRARPALWFGALALVAALPFITGPTLRYGWGEHVRSLKQQPEVGYYMVLGAIAAALMGAVLLRRRGAATARQ
jgi:uncharacterized membrane protein YhaH (DUF805 family)